MVLGGVLKSGRGGKGVRGGGVLRGAADVVQCGRPQPTAAGSADPRCPSQATWKPLAAGEDKVTDCPQLLRRSTASCCFDFSPVRSMPDF